MVSGPPTQEMSPAALYYPLWLLLPLDLVRINAWIIIWIIIGNLLLVLYTCTFWPNKDFKLLKRQPISMPHACSHYISSSPRWLCARLMFYQQHYYSSCLLCCVTHPWSTGWSCGTLLHCEEEMWLSEVLFSSNGSQAAAAAATVSTSLWGRYWPVSEHWTEGECRIWTCTAVNIAWLG